MRRRCLAIIASRISPRLALSGERTLLAWIRPQRTSRGMRVSVGNADEGALEHGRQPPAAPPPPRRHAAHAAGFTPDARAASLRGGDAAPLSSINVAQDHAGGGGI